MRYTLLVVFSLACSGTSAGIGTRAPLDAGEGPGEGPGAQPGERPRPAGERDAGEDDAALDAALEGTSEVLPEPDADAPVPDTAVDASPDAVVDASPDTAVDASPDAVVDAAPDLPADAPPEAKPEASVTDVVPYCYATVFGRCTGSAPFSGITYTCECCPLGAGRLNCECSIPCESDDDCTIPDRMHCEKPPVAGDPRHGFCTAEGYVCCWDCK